MKKRRVASLLIVNVWEQIGHQQWIWNGHGFTLMLEWSDCSTGDNCCGLSWILIPSWVSIYLFLSLLDDLLFCYVACVYNVQVHSSAWAYRNISVACYQILWFIHGAEVSNKSTVFLYIMHAMQILMVNPIFPNHLRMSLSTNVAFFSFCYSYPTISSLLYVNSIHSLIYQNPYNYQSK